MTEISIDPTGFIGKRINEMQLYDGMCVINFVDGSCLEIIPEIHEHGEKVRMEYNFTPAESSLK